MDNKNESEINDILKNITANIKSELENIKSEIKDSLKTELDSIRTELKSEIDEIRTARKPSKDSPEPEPSPFKESPEPDPDPFKDFSKPDPHPFRDFFESEMFNFDDNVETKTYDFSDFSKIHIGGTFSTEIINSDSYSISVTAGESLFRNLDIFKDGDTLKIQHSKHIGWRAMLTRPRVTISLPLLRELHLSGAAGVTIRGFDSSEIFKLDMSGASGVTGDIKAGSVDIDLSGASHARLSGSASDAVIKASGAIRIDMRGFPVNNAAVKLSGASNVSANVNGRLDARLSGASNFSWVGDPIMGDIKTSGVSRLNRE